jgi:hypothetical protein
LSWKVFDTEGRLLINLNNGPANGPIYTLSEVGIVARAGGGEIYGRQLVAVFNYVDTVATTNDSVKLLPAILNTIQVVENRGVEDMIVYTQLLDQFSDASTSYLVPSGSTLSVICNPTGTWNFMP